MQWTIIGKSEGADITTDIIYQQPQNLVFMQDQSESSIHINVVNDNLAELSEIFELRLIGASLDGEIDESSRIIEFTIM